MKALVTGGAGFIGSHLVDALLEGGAQVEILDDLSTGRLENLESALAREAVFHQEDIVSSPRLSEIFSDFGPDVVFHLAAQMDVRRSVSDPGFDALVNVAGTARTLSAATAAGCRRFVLASTGGAIYGEGIGRNLPFSETDELLPVAPYGQSKAAAEGYVGLFTRAGTLEGTSLRFGNVYGPRQDPAGEAGVVAIFLGRAAEGAPLRVFGDGHQTRDYVFVDDVVRAFLAAADGNKSGTFNIATGRETSVNRLVELIADLYGDREIEVIREGARAGEIGAVSLDSSRARTELGWTSSVDLAEGLSLTATSSSD